MADEFAIKVENLHKSFRLPHDKSSSLKSTLINFHKRGYEEQLVLEGIDFEIKKGEFFGIVGRNGSGKSTLLKLLAGIYTPEEGQVHVRGKLTPFIELGVGFNPELTGRENIFLNGALLGFNRKEMLAMYDEIVDFAELHRFMDQKLKNYSSGMQVRLAFSIAIRAQSDILLFDEVLAVGDAAFQQKCYDMFENMHAEGRTVVLVTHDMSAVQRFCSRALLINKGKIELIGDPNDIADRYLEQNFSSDGQKKVKKNNDDQPEMQSKFEIKNFTIGSTKASKSLALDEPLDVGFTVVNHEDQKNLRIGLQIYSGSGVYCYGTNTKVNGMPSFSGRMVNVGVKLDHKLLPGTYYVTLAVMNEAATKVLFYKPRVGTFNIKQETQVQGVVAMKTEWRINTDV